MEGSLKRLMQGAVGPLLIAAVTAVSAERVDAQVRGYEFGAAARLAVVDADDTARHFDLELPARGLRFGVLLTERLLLDTEIGARYRARGGEDWFGSFELLTHLVWDTTPQGGAGFYAGGGAGISHFSARNFFLNGRLGGMQPVMALRGGATFRAAEVVVLRAGGFLRHYFRNDQRPYRRTGGFEFSAGVRIE